MFYARLVTPDLKFLHRIGLVGLLAGQNDINRVQDLMSYYQ